MNILGIRFCSVSEQANADLEFFEKGLGLTNTMDSNQDFVGGVFPTQDKKSWIECWQAGSEMPAGLMLQLVVEDADAFAENVKNNGLQPYGPVEAHGEKIYYLKTPSGISMSFQSKLP